MVSTVSRNCSAASWLIGGASASPGSAGEPVSRADLRPRRLFLPALRRRGRLQRIEQPAADASNVGDGRIERRLVRPRRLVEAADLPDELQRGREDLFLRDRRLEVEERPDVSAHPVLPPGRVFDWGTLLPSESGELCL